MAETLEDALGSAQNFPARTGGLVVVALGATTDLPSDWTFHPMVHGLMTTNLHPRDVPNKIPSNTKIVIITEEIPRQVYQTLQRELKRRRLNYIVRKTTDAIDVELHRMFPKPKREFIEKSPPDAKSESKTEKTPETPAIESGKRGSVNNFIGTYANLSTETSLAEEARRLFVIAQRMGIKTTLASLQQGIRVAKRKKGIGSRPESASPVLVTASTNIMASLETAISALQHLKKHAETLDAESAALKKENVELRARIVLMRDAFKNIDE